MGFIENLLINGDLRESRMMSRWGVNLVQEKVQLSHEEQSILKTYIIGYYSIQKSGEFVDYKKVSYWKILRLIPPIPQVVYSAEMSTRMGKELIEESLDLEYILRAGNKIPKRNLRNLGNLLSGIISSVESGKISDQRYAQIRTQLSNIIENWCARAENQ